MTAGRTRRTPAAALAAAIGAALAIGGCGSSAKTATTTVHPPTTATSAAPTPAVSALPAAEHPAAGQFPAPTGRSLTQLARLAQSGVQFGAATGTYTPGTRRVAFALTDSANRFVYAPTAIYISTSTSGPVQGPFLAPADPVGVAPQYRSAQNSAPGGLKAIYAAQVPLTKAKVYLVLALARTGGGLIGATGEVAVAKSSPIPDVGQRPPAISTETPAAVHGNIGLLTTRTPPESMHSVSFNQVLGKRPVALLISTPELCTSRVCGPVTDVVVSLQHEFPQIAFVHQEVYVNNQPSRGLRPQLHAFHLETEPWLFTINRRGVIAARIEGTWGVNEARQALEAALR